MTINVLFHKDPKDDKYTRIWREPAPVVMETDKLSYTEKNVAFWKNRAEISLNAILLANEEYTSNNGAYYYYTGCSGTSYENVQNNLFDGKETLPAEDWQICIQGNSSAQTLQIIAKHKTKTCKLILTEKMGKPEETGSDC